MPRNSLTDQQRERNAAVAGQWSAFQPHRSRVTGLICKDRDQLSSEAASSESLCVLGAGNCNDLDLSELLCRFSRIDLVDIDAEALRNGVRSQSCADHPGVTLYGDCDVTGVWTDLALAKERGLSDNDVPSLLAKLLDSGVRSLAHEIDRPQNGYSVVASTCLLSQLVDALTNCIGQQHQHFLEIAFALRLDHLRLMTELLSGGGRGLLVTDFVSSETIPDLADIPAERLSGYLSMMIDSGNFFTALNPFRILNLFQEDAELAGNVRAFPCEPPWLWDLGPRHYAVTAIPFVKNRS